MKNYSLLALLPLMAFGLALSGCSDSDDEAPSNPVSDNAMSSEMMSSSDSSTSSSMMMQSSYRVSIMNFSHAQILSPAAVIISDGSMKLFSIGEPASTALEMLAEAGMPDDLLAMYADATAMSTGPTMPGMITSIDISAPQNQYYLTLATMPVYTNDGIAAVQNIDISHLMAGESKTIMATVYDAGTEGNSEALNTIPGPDIGGEGYNSSREGDRNFVAIHPGVVGSAELGSSALNESYRFSEGSFQIKIEKM